MTGFIRRPLHQAAFTLLELIIVILLVAILATYIQSKFSTSDSYKQDAVVEQLINAARLTQQLAMNDADRLFVLALQTNQIDILADGSSLAGELAQLPIILPSGVSLTMTSNISFDQLGATTPLTVGVLAGTVRNVCLEASGYIHSC